jgi:CheY-like chemotaxis protein
MQQHHTATGAPAGKILLVDDSEVVTQTIKTYLETYGHQVAMENSAFKAVSAALREQPDVVVLDIKMPGRDGGSILEQMRSEPTLAHTPVIFLTGLLTKDETGDGIERQGSIYLSKQAKFSALLKLVNRLVANRNNVCVAV